jgi:hypothetical protein
MEENRNSQIDAFLKKELKEIPLENPSKDFTKNIMGVISSEETSEITNYIPLISKKMWIGIASVLAILSLALVFVPFQQEEESLLDKIPLDFSFLTKISFSGFIEVLAVSNTTLYAMVLFSLLVFAQVFYLKGYFTKRALQ